MAFNQRRSEISVPPGKLLRYYHSPFQVEFDGITVKCDENGRVTLTKDVGEDEVEEIEVSANVIYKTAKMLNTTKNHKFIDKITKND